MEGTVDLRQKVECKMASSRNSKLNLSPRTTTPIELVFNTTGLVYVTTSCCVLNNY